MPVVRRAGLTCQDGPTLVFIVTGWEWLARLAVYKQPSVSCGHPHRPYTLMAWFSHDEHANRFPNTIKSSTHVVCVIDNTHKLSMIINRCSLINFVPEHKRHGILTSSLLCYHPSIPATISITWRLTASYTGAFIVGFKRSVNILSLVVPRYPWMFDKTLICYENALAAACPADRSLTVIFSRKKQLLYIWTCQTLLG